MPWLVTTGPTLLYAGAFGIGFVLLALGLGRRLLIWLGVGDAATPLERGALALAAGAGALQVIPFALGAVGALSVTSVRLATAVLALALSFDVWAVLKRARQMSNVSPRPA